MELIVIEFRVPSSEYIKIEAKGLNASQTGFIVPGAIKIYSPSGSDKVHASLLDFQEERKRS